MQKLFIQNRKGQKMAVVVDESPSAQGLVFIMHGLSGSKEQLHLRAMGDAFKENGFSVIYFDTTNTFGESDGNYENATVTNYFEDLEDVIAWAKIQAWFIKPFCLAGHSLGGICTALYAEKYPEKIKAIAPISTVVSGQLSLEAHPKEKIENWKNSGWRIEESSSKPGLIKKLKWSHFEDRLKYNLLEQANKLVMPVLLIVGEQDRTTPLEHQQIFFDKLPGQKELHVIKGSGHTFKEDEHLAEIKNIFDKWIKQL